MSPTLSFALALAALLGHDDLLAKPFGFKPVLPRRIDPASRRRGFRAAGWTAAFAMLVLQGGALLSGAAAAFLPGGGAYDIDGLLRACFTALLAPALAVFIRPVLRALSARAEGEFADRLPFLCLLLALFGGAAAGHALTPVRSGLAVFAAALLFSEIREKIALTGSSGALKTVQTVVAALLLLLASLGFRAF